MHSCSGRRSERLTYSQDRILSISFWGNGGIFPDRHASGGGGGGGGFDGAGAGIVGAMTGWQKGDRCLERDVRARHRPRKGGEVEGGVEGGRWSSDQGSTYCKEGGGGLGG